LTTPKLLKKKFPTTVTQTEEFIFLALFLIRVNITSLKGQVAYQNKYFTHLMKKLDSLDFFESFKITLDKKGELYRFLTRAIYGVMSIKNLWVNLKKILKKTLIIFKGNIKHIFKLYDNKSYKTFFTLF
jgi:hypothetical protein